MSNTLTSVQLPPKLEQQVNVFLKDGWFFDMDTLIVEALRRYLETHKFNLMERFIMEDVEWGLHGDE